MNEHGDGPARPPATETRGGEDGIDWDNARPGEPLQRKPDPDVVRGVERVTGEKYDPETGQWHAS